ncbi:hypothetical protein L208DRAFT_1279757 [Tricholoma matsutake]|nr:hypothetical protein L208DRAFT_1279757 [Tricholoma matsutake 945]
MSLMKLPFTIAVIASLHVTHTTPNPTSEGEGKRVAEGWIRIPHFVLISKYLFWIIGMAEIVVVIANNTKGLPISQRVLASLVVGGAADQIRMTPLFVFWSVIAALGGWGRSKCYDQLGKQFTFEVNIREDHKLVTTGLYSVVRHPSYAAGTMAIIGTTFFHASRGSWLRESGVLDTMIGKILAYSIIISTFTMLPMIKARWEREDKELKKEFGKQWDDWAQRVPDAVLPGIL